MNISKVDCISSFFSIKRNWEKRSLEIDVSYGEACQSAVCRYVPSINKN